jgi:hypothetical protein
MMEYWISVPDWQIKANLLVLPMLPQPEEEVPGWWSWKFRKDACVRWHKDEPFPACDYDFLPYQSGDRIFLTEATAVSWPPSAPVSLPDYQRHEVASVQVLQAASITADHCYRMGINIAKETVRSKWNPFYSRYPWNPDLWVIGLEVRRLG